MSTELDIEFVRTQFPAFAEPSLAGTAFFENAGGSYACRQVIDRLGEYYRRLKVQPYGGYAASREAGQWMDQAYERLAPYLGVPPDWLHFGPSTSQNTYVLAQAARKRLRRGDEIIVSQQDHEANGGVWRHLSDDGVVVRNWNVDSRSGRLDPAALAALITPRTRLLAFPHCSNIVAEINPVRAIVAQARAAGVWTVVDAVSYAGHGLADLAELDVDAYLFSMYKTFGPHQGLMALRPAFLDWLGNEGHYFNAKQPRKRMVPAGPDHAQVAAAAGVAEYFDALDAHHFPSADPAHRAPRIRALLKAAEWPLLQKLLDAVKDHPALRLLGPADAARRAATVALQVTSGSPADVVAKLAERGIMAGSGHFYSVRLLEAMGLAPDPGVLRLSFVHYTSVADVDRLIDALNVVLPH